MNAFGNFLFRQTEFNSKMNMQNIVHWTALRTGSGWWPPLELPTWKISWPLVTSLISLQKPVFGFSSLFQSNHSLNRDYFVGYQSIYAKLEPSIWYIRLCPIKAHYQNKRFTMQSFKWYLFLAASPIVRWLTARNCSVIYRKPPSAWPIACKQVITSRRVITRRTNLVRLSYRDLWFRREIGRAFQAKPTRRYFVRSCITVCIVMCS